ncbi:MAG: serine/threonine protein kinase [Geodermatophilaceae bacterium]|nr:serine/threonine protein kinase [Geodermatophilaceae bacterium]
MVWQARQVELGRLVAIKELSPALLSAPGFLERFRAEAQMLAGLDDPHVVRLYDYVEEPHRAFLVQEWVEGAPLTAVLDRHGRLTAEQSLGVIRGGLLGLAHAHQRGLVHRDVSTANILLDGAGVSKLVDFGLAAPSGAAGVGPGVGQSSTGTPAFSSPEAVSGQPMTARSDVYAAAAVLFALLSGRPPYVGNMQSVLQAHVAAPAPALSGFAPRLTNLLWRAMAKRPEDRPADAAAFLAELEEAATEAYGAGWLGRASVAGLTSAAAMGVGSATAFSGAGPPAAAQALAYGTANTPGVFAGQHVPAAASSVGARVLGIPRVALMVASAVVVAAVAATAVVLTISSDDPESAAAGQESTSTSARQSSRPTTTAPTTTTPPPVPAFGGMYDVVLTLTGISGDVFDAGATGNAQNFTWEITATCPAGVCDVSVISSSGNTFDFGYAAGSWSYQDRPSSVECVDSVSGVPNGETAPSTITATLTPSAPIDATGATPIPALSGTVVETVPAPGCGGGEAIFTQSVEATLVER